jgi:hypothetical protein
MEYAVVRGVITTALEELYGICSSEGYNSSYACYLEKAACMSIYMGLWQGHISQ